MVAQELIIKQTDSWTWSAFPNQSYLGRVQFTLRRKCEGSLASLSDEEWSDLRASLVAYEALIGKTFATDRFNYVQLGNVWPQVHVHGIPRYQAAPKWNGVAFPDTRWGDVPLPEPASPISEDQTLAFAAELRSMLSDA